MFMLGSQTHSATANKTGFDHPLWSARIGPDDCKGQYSMDPRGTHSEASGKAFGTFSHQSRGHQNDRCHRPCYKFQSGSCKFSDSTCQYSHTPLPPMAPPSIRQHPYRNHIRHQTPISLGCSHGNGYQGQEFPTGPHSDSYAAGGTYGLMWNARYSNQPSVNLQQCGFPLSGGSRQNWGSHRNTYRGGRFIQQNNNVYSRQVPGGARPNGRAQNKQALYTAQGPSGRRNSIDSSVSNLSTSTHDTYSRVHPYTCNNSNVSTQELRKRVFESIARNKADIKNPIDKPIEDQTVHEGRDTTRRELNETTKRLEELRAKIKAQTRQKAMKAMVVQEPGIDRLDNPRSTLSGNPQLSDALPLDFERSETDGSGEEQRTVKLKRSWPVEYGFEDAQASKKSKNIHSLSIPISQQAPGALRHGSHNLPSIPATNTTSPTKQLLTPQSTPPPHLYKDEEDQVDWGDEYDDDGLL